MKNIFLKFALVAIVFFSCKPQTSTTHSSGKSVKEVVGDAVISEVLAPKEFMTKFNQAKNPILLDVRTPSEVSLGTVESSQNIDYNAPDFQEKLKSLDKAKPVFVFCARGGRSASAATVLKSLGFKEIYDMKGGFTDYKEAFPAK